MASKHLKSLVLYTGLIGGMLISMFPFYWLIVMSTRTTSDIYKFPPQLWFGVNYGIILRAYCSRLISGAPF